MYYLDNNINNETKVFINSCSGNYMIIVKLIYLLKNNVIDNDIIKKMIIWSCNNGYTGLAKWLYSLGNYIDCLSNVYFLGCYMDGHIEMVKWICSINNEYMRK